MVRILFFNEVGAPVPDGDRAPVAVADVDPRIRRECECFHPHLHRTVYKIPDVCQVVVVVFDLKGNELLQHGTVVHPDGSVFRYP